MKKLTCLISMLFVGFISNSQCRLDKSNWTLFWSEEFNGPSVSSLFAPQRWTHNYPEEIGESKLYSCSSDDQIELFEGIGYFNTHKLDPPEMCGGKMSAIKRVWIHTDFDELPDPATTQYGGGFLYGMFEIRCKLPGAPPANFPPNGTKNLGAGFLSYSKKVSPEFDVFEYHAGDDYFWSSIHWNDPYGYQGCNNTYQFQTMAIDNAFHTWTFVWTPTQLTWFLDGKELKTDNNQFRFNEPAPSFVSTIDDFVKWMKSDFYIGGGLLWNEPGQTAATQFEPFLVDYFRVYKPNGYVPYTSTNPSWSSVSDWYYNHLLPAYNSVSYKSTGDWVSNVIDPISPSPVYGELQGLQGGGKYMYKGPGNVLWCSQWTPSGFYNFPVDWSHTITGNLVLAPFNNGDITLYREGSNINYAIGGTTTQVSGINDAIGDIVPFDQQSFYYVANTGLKRIKRALYTPGPTPYTISNVGSAIFKSDLILDPNNPDRVIFADISSNISQYELTSSGWTYTPITSSNDVASDLVISPGGNELFFKSTGNTLKHLLKNSITGVWGVASDFLAIAPGSSTLGSITNIKSSIICSQDPANPSVMWIGTDNRPWGAYYNGGTYMTTWFDWNLANVASDFKLITYGQTPGTNHLCYVGTDNKIRTLEWNSPCEVNPSCFTTRQMRLGKPQAAIDSISSRSAELAEISNGTPSGTVSSIVNKLGVIAYPNPTLATLNIHLQEDEHTEFSWAVYDIVGRCSLRGYCAGNQGVIDMHTVTPGSYVVEIVSKNQAVKFSIAKQQ